MRQVTNDAIAVLEAGGLDVGDGVNTDTAGIKLTVPYVVVYPLDDDRDGTLGDPYSTDVAGTVLSGYQITCVGESRQQAQWLADRVVELLTAPGAGDWHVQLDPSGPLRRDDDTGAAPLFYAYPRITLHT